MLPRFDIYFEDRADKSLGAVEWMEVYGERIWCSLLDEYFFKVFGAVELGRPQAISDYGTEYVVYNPVIALRTDPPIVGVYTSPLKTAQLALVGLAGFVHTLADPSYALKLQRLVWRIKPEFSIETSFIERGLFIKIYARATVVAYGAEKKVYEEDAAAQA